MPSANYINVGSALLFNGEAGADLAFSVEGLANGAGRVSAQHDAGAAPRPYIYSWSCELQWQATPTQYAGFELYLAKAPDTDATQIDGDVGAADAALGDVDSVRNLQFLGSVISENAAGSQKCVASGEFICYTRYFSIVGLNNGGAAINATDSAFRFDLTPIYFEAQ